MFKQATRQNAIQAGGTGHADGQSVLMSLKALDWFYTQGKREELQWVVDGLRRKSDSPAVRGTAAQAVLQTLANEWQPLALA